jgi:DNA-binding NarL/FixJ family response regulator
MQHEGFEVVGEAGDGRQAVRAAEDLKPDVMIMDIGMPSLNGIEATAQIVKRNPSIRVIILSVHSDEEYLLRALNAGAKGYLLKESAHLDLKRAVEAVAQGHSFFSPTISKMLMEDFVQQLQRRGMKDSYDLLTDREKEILQLLAEGKSNKEIAAMLNLSVYTVETHRTHLMQKLDLHSAVDIVMYAVRKKIIS